MRMLEKAMLNADGAETPPGVVTVTLAGPLGAPAATVKVAVICDALTTVALLTWMFVPALTTTSEFKLVPLMVTGVAAPAGPVDGAMDEIAGAAGAVCRISTALTFGLPVTGRN